MKYIFVTGGVVSGLGKGICAASLGRLLKQCGLRVRNQKFDPYLNVDPGTMSPYQHGEVFVTDDGAETDLDLGHYERFVDEALTGDSSVSSGKIFWSVLNRERQGGYLGGTVQIIPHVTDEIKRRLYAMDDGQTDVVIAEIGGTVGDIESQPYLEAIRQVAAEQGRENVLYIHVPLVVSIPGSGELKSKPTQHSVKELLSVGIQPDILVCRTDSPLPEDMRKKIALFCNVSEDCVIPNLTASTLYEVPLLLEREGLCRVVCRKLGLGAGEPDMRHWQELVTQIHAAEQRHVTIALVGKYTELHDAYLSVAESLFHAGTACGAHVDIQWVDSQHLTAENLTETLCGCSGILVPGGFKRVSSVTDILVPVMACLYVLGALVIIFAHVGELPAIFGMIFQDAFTGRAAVGGFAGATVMAAIRWGAARGVYSNEAGVGSTIAGHCTADTDHPIRQAQFGIFEVFMDTIVICTITALAVLASGVWTQEGLSSGQLALAAFQSVFGNFGAIFVAITVFMFVFSTIISAGFFGQIQAEILFGRKFSKIWVFMYPLFIGIACAFSNVTTMYMITDGFMAIIVILNMIGLLLMCKQVKDLQKEYYNTPGMYYLADKAAKEAKKAAK